MFGLTFEKLLLIGVIAVFLLGPERLPGYAAKLAQLVRGVRDMANGAKERMRDEMGPEFDDVDWKKLDPRQYDPRRIIREALLDDAPGGAGAAGAAGAAAAAGSASVRPVRPGGRPEPAYLQRKAKSPGGPVPVAGPEAEGAPSDGLATPDAAAAPEAAAVPAPTAYDSEAT